MSQITWKAGFNYDAVDFVMTPTQLTAIDFKSDNNRISYFSVEGGAKRMIDLRSPDVASLPLELQDARQHKNIRLFVPLKNVLVLSQFNIIFARQLSVTLLFALVGYHGRTPNQALFLSSAPSGARVIEPPMPQDVHGHRVFALRFGFTDKVNLSHNVYPHGWHGKDSYEEQI
jgi:hypothetical protein